MMFDDNMLSVQLGGLTRQRTRVMLPVTPYAEPLPPPEVGLCVGRNSEVAQVVAEWTAGRVVAVVGAPGIGKSTVLGRAIGDSSVLELFGGRRYVVPCDGADSASAVVDKLAQALGVTPGDHLRNRVMSFLHAERCVVVLDNFETVTDGDPRGSAGLVAELRAGPNPVVLGLGYRGVGLSAVVSGAVEIRLEPLAAEATVEMFVAVAGERHRQNPALGELLADLDGVPLAIMLLANLASSEMSLGTLILAWRAKRTNLLQHAAQPDRTSSLPVSLELSWDRLSGDARAVLSLVALLPDGWPHGQSALYLPDELAAGVIELGRRALLHDDNARQRCLAPIRQHVRLHHEPDRALVRKLTTRIRVLTEHCEQVGEPAGAAATTKIVPEFTNIVDVLRFGLTHEPDLLPAITAIVKFQEFTGLGDDQLALDALEAASTHEHQGDIAFRLAMVYKTRGDIDRSQELFKLALALRLKVDSVVEEADCLRNLGEVEVHKSHYDRARQLSDDALSLFKRVGDELGEAHCLSTFGQIELLQSNYSQARESFRRSLELYHRVDSLVGEADCLHSIALIDFLESEHNQSRRSFNRALELYQRVGAMAGEAHCLSGLGGIEFLESNFDKARNLNSRSLLLYQRVGSRLGEANALTGLGLIEVAESNYGRAREYFDNALRIFRQVGDTLGEANSLRNLGLISMAESNHGQARALINQAILLYERVDYPIGNANSLDMLGQIEFIEANYDKARGAFSQALLIYQHIGAMSGGATMLANLGNVAFSESNLDQAEEFFTRALTLYQQTGHLRMQAIIHAWLARTTTGGQRDGHCAHIARIADELDAPDLQESLREISGC